MEHFFFFFFFTVSGYDLGSGHKGTEDWAFQFSCHEQLMVYI